MRFVIRESQIKRIHEQVTTQAAAMDLDIYNQDMETPAGDFNSSTEESIEEIIEKLQEILSMVKTGKEIKTTIKSKIFKNLDDIKNIYSDIKYKRNLQRY